LPAGEEFRRGFSGKYVDSDKKHRLETTINTLQDRWGSKAIGRWKESQAEAISHVSTSFPALDEALVVGGLPCGRISEIDGIPSSGMATIALKIMVEAQARKNMTVYIDLEQNFDPAYAARCGLSLEQLVLVRPHTVSQALAILQDFIVAAAVDILVFDAPLGRLVESQASQALATTLGRLIASLGRTESVLLFLVSLPAGSPFATGEQPVNSALAHFATIRLLVQREGWIYRHGDISGYQTQILILKNKLGPAGKQISVNVVFDDDAPAFDASTLGAPAFGGSANGEGL
jgi:recombination protein RecA